MVVVDETDECDRAIYFAMTEKLQSGMKLDFAYDEVRREFGVSRSMVIRAYGRIRKLTDEAGDQSRRMRLS